MKIKKLTFPLLIVFMDRKKCAIKDHCDANNETQAMLCAKGTDARVNILPNIISEYVEFIFVLQGKLCKIVGYVVVFQRCIKLPQSEQNELKCGNKKGTNKLCFSL